jgi:CheY-like chemotaxis protein
MPYETPASEERRRVLIVDDDPEWREFCRLSLQDLGYETLEASSGQEALEQLARHRPEIMLLDLHMPGMDGEEVIDNLPRSAPRVVLMTAADHEAVGHALANGAQYYLPKGSSREALSLLLESLAH